MAQVMWYSSPLGRILLAAEGEALTGLWFEGQRYFARGLGEDREERETPVLRRGAEWLDRYFAGEKPEPCLPLAPAGTAFQRAVWELLLEIPYGETTTYGALAAELARRGRPSSPRAVGGAVGRNPISILIPCHRVLGRNGALTGYAAGEERKKRLLALEAGAVKRE